MKVLVLVSALLSFGAFAADYTVDPGHSSVSFSIRHMVSKVPGNFKEFEGKFTYDDKKIENSKAEFTIQAKSIDTNNAKRDEHLRSADFFDVEKCKTLSFVTKSVKGKAKKFTATGDLTMHCVTKPASFEIEYMGEVRDPWGNMKAGFAATTTLKRKDWGIIWNKALDAGSVMLGDEVEVKLDIEAKKEEVKVPAKN